MLGLLSTAGGLTRHCRRTFLRIVAAVLGMASVPQGSGSGGVAGSGTPTTSTVTTTKSDMTASDGQVVLADASGGAITVTLPGPTSGDSVVVKKTDSTANTVTIARPGGENIDGDASDRTLSGEDQSRHITSDGSDYFVI